MEYFNLFTFHLIFQIKHINTLLQDLMANGSFKLIFSPSFLY
jgi:hypothetical protein